MDPKLKEKCIDCGGTLCPFCGSASIEPYRDTMAENDNGIVILYMCCTCSEEWENQYELKEVRYVPGDDRANAEVPVRTKTRPTE